MSQPCTHHLNNFFTRHEPTYAVKINSQPHFKSIKISPSLAKKTSLKRMSSHASLTIGKREKFIAYKFVKYFALGIVWRSETTLLGGTGRN